MSPSSAFLMLKGYDMYRLREIRESWRRLVGWEKDTALPDDIAPVLGFSESGLYFNGAHPLVTTANIEAVMPENFGMGYAPYNPIRTYERGDIVTFEGAVWFALGRMRGIAPGTSADFNMDYNDDFAVGWMRYSSVSAYLQKLTDDGIAKVVTTFIERKKLARETRSLVSRRTLFDGAGRIANSTDNEGRLVGIEVLPVRAMGVTTKIERIGLQFTRSADITVRIYHSSQVFPVYEKTLHYDGNGSFRWFVLDDVYLPYLGDDHAGGSWYVTYRQDELPLGCYGINVSKDWSREPCGTCNVGSVQVWREVTRYAAYSPFFVEGKELNADNAIWDIAQNTYTNTLNYGLNLEVSVGCDLTDVLVSQREMFASVLQKQVAADVLALLMNNPNVRVNRNQTNASRLDIAYDLNGQDGHGGLGRDLRRAYDALEVETKGLDRVCLCNHTGGVRYGSV